MKQKLILMAVSVMVLLTACSGSNNVGSTQDAMTIEDIVKQYFDDNEWHYEMSVDQDSVIKFEMGFELNNGQYDQFVVINHKKDLYTIVCYPRKTIAEDTLLEAIVAMNNFNMQSGVVCGYINRQGDVRFWIGRNIEGKTYSYEAFNVDFQMVLNTADEEFPRISSPDPLP